MVEKTEAGGDDGAVDVVIAGGGPAGRWLGVHLLRQGMSIAVVDPRPDQEWTNTYGVWLDEVEEVVPERCFRRTWEEVEAYLPDRRRIGRGYGLVDNTSFRQMVDGELRDRGARIVQGVVRQVRDRGDHAEVHCDENRQFRARVVVDASGGRARLATGGARSEVAYQRAYGMVARFDGDPLDGAAMVLMDYRPINGEYEAFEGPPTFLYGMHLGEDLYFVEETVLVGPETVDFQWLRRRLMGRLHSRGIRRRGAIQEEERCHIPMGTALAAIEEPVMPFGASAGLVHPATGYQMSRMLRAAPPVAQALARGRRRGVVGTALAHRGWDILWPDEVRRGRQLLVFGRDVLRGLDRRQLGRFFESFFDLRTRDWRDYLLGEVGVGRLSQVMWRLFGRLDTDLQWRLVQRSVAEGKHLYGAFFPRWLDG